MDPSKWAQIRLNLGYMHKSLHVRTFFTLADTIGAIFTEITEDWPCANRAVVTNNSTVIIKVVLIEVVLIEGFRYLLIEVSSLN